jgi:thiamine-phosphate pyrophosphorylase
MAQQVSDSPRAVVPAETSRDSALGLQFSALGPRPILSAVLDGASLGPDPGARAHELFSHGVDWIQLRDRSLADDALWKIVRALEEARAEVATVFARGGTLTSHLAPRVLLNKRIDLARAANTRGVHLGFDSLTPSISRTFLGTGSLIGLSLHSVDEVEAVSKEPRTEAPHYVHLAPIWAPRSKAATRPALGLGRLVEACRFGICVIAQGGLDEQRAADSIKAGAAGIALSGGLMSSSDLPRTVRGLRHSLDQAALSLK